MTSAIRHDATRHVAITRRLDRHDASHQEELPHRLELDRRRVANGGHPVVRILGHLRAALRRVMWCAVVALTLSIVAALGCGSAVTSVHRAGAVKANSRWALLPLQNHSETPQAGERVESILETLLRQRGVSQLDHYPAPKEGDAQLFASDRQRYEAALEWARGGKYDYALSGSVEEWRYKSGLDGEPAIGVSMRVVELKTGRVIWAATGTRTGTGAENASGTALRLLDKLVAELSEGGR
ncbi:MAG: Extracellular Matrix protein PelC [Labilithrix sp.]|nr:Extracellular Matrix protein PelC [Labilithrix sp.]